MPKFEEWPAHEKFWPLSVVSLGASSLPSFKRNGCPWNNVSWLQLALILKIKQHLLVDGMVFLSLLMKFCKNDAVYNALEDNITTTFWANGETGRF